MSIYLAALAATAALASPAMADPEPPAPTSATPTTSAAPEPSAPSSTAPEPSKPEAPNPPVAPAAQTLVEAKVVFDKPRYRTDEDVRFTFKVKNIVSAPLVGLRVVHDFMGPTDVSVPPGPAPQWPGWGQLGSRPGVTLEPGATFEVKVTGQIKDVEKAIATVRGFVSADTGQGYGLGIGYFDSSVPVEKIAGHSAGVVFGDKNGNGLLDSGEQLADTTLNLRYANGTKVYTAKSDARGRIDFGNIPAAKYVFEGEVIKGWLFPWETIQIRPDKKDLLIRGAPPLNGALKASVAFNRHDYTKGELARITVTLSNTGPIPLTGIVAECNRIGDDFSVGGGAGWGPLSYFANGVTIAPGQTRTFQVSDPVPDAAFDRGILKVDCDFGYRGVDIGNHAQAGDKAPVSGGKATVRGFVFHEPGEGKPLKGLAGVKVVLVSERACPVVGEQTTDADGNFEFHNVAPGPDYWLYLLPPQGWRTTAENPQSTIVTGPVEQPDRRWIGVEPGDAPLPTVPTQVPNCGVTSTPPAPVPGGQQPGSASGQSGNAALASTGADVLGLGAFTLVALALGAALILASRRRRQPD